MSTIGATLNLDGTHSNDANPIFDLQGNGGELALLDSATTATTSHIVGVHGNEVLTNDLGHAIAGAGTITAAVQNHFGTIMAISKNTSNPNPLILSSLLNLDGASNTLNDGAYIANGTQLRIGNAGAQIVINNAAITLQNGGRITNGAGSDIVAPFLTTNQGSFNLINTTVTLANALTNEFFGTIDLESNSTLQTPGLTNNGANHAAITVGAGSLLKVTGAITNIDPSGNLSQGGYFLAGTLQYTGNSDITALINTGVTLDENGKFFNTQTGHNAMTRRNSIDSNSFLALQNGASLTLVNGPLLNAGGLTVGDGTVASSLTAPGLSNSGTVNVDLLGALTVTGDYTQSSSGDLLIQIAGNTLGSGYGQLDDHGFLATLDGKIEFDFISFAPSASDLYIVMLYGSHSGTFASVIIDNLPG